MLLLQVSGDPATLVLCCAVLRAVLRAVLLEQDGPAPTFHDRALRRVDQFERDPDNHAEATPDRHHHHHHRNHDQFHRIVRLLLRLRHEAEPDPVGHCQRPRSARTHLLHHEHVDWQ